MNRPTCAVLPAAINSQTVSASFGCVGNRVYTGASENEAYVAIPGATLDTVVESLRTILRAFVNARKLSPSRGRGERFSRALRVLDGGRAVLRTGHKSQFGQAGSTNT